MTPEDEIENIIQETVMNDFCGVLESYPMTTFPETHIIKISACYILRIDKHCYQNEEVIKRYKEVRNHLYNRKIIVKNKILDKQRDISMGGISEFAVVPIYYEDCIFTNSNLSLGLYCENCIIVRD